LVFLAKLSVEEAVDVGLAGSLAVDAAVVDAIVVVEVGLVTTLVEDATQAVVVVEVIVVVEVGLVTTLVEDATLLIVDVHVKEAILLIVDALAAL
jgi:nicotinamidase-related amidase